jgi:uncharacterized membrane protein
MNWIVYLYAFYFVLLAVSVGLFASEFTVEGAGVLLGIVLAHFLAGTVRYFTSNITLEKRYSQFENVIADFLLLLATGFAIFSLADIERIEWYYSAFALALVGNTFCIVGHIRQKKPYTTVRTYPM